jgi:putative hydrolase of the HAD superfamily
MIVVFDLDDTLYLEIEFVLSGYRVVAQALATEFKLPYREIYSKMKSILFDVGRDRIFDKVLLSYGIYSESRVMSCLDTYRTHTPDITLSDDAGQILEVYKEKSLYLVTDGDPSVQNSKIDALGIRGYFKDIFTTWTFGIQNAKPSLTVFRLICQKENIELAEICYIGDDPNKDFFNLNQAGAKTIRILRGRHSGVILDEKHDAKYKIKNLLELNVLLGTDGLK